MSSPNQHAAVELATKGFAVFPCNADKTPRVKAWQETPVLPAWQVDAKWVASHSDALPGIVTGRGIVVIDCDNRPGAPSGTEAFSSLCVSDGVDLSGAFVVSTPNNGLHYYFRTDTPYGNSRGSLPAGIDVRGIGGYVIAPGASLPDGRSYRIAQGSLDAISPLPDALAAFLRPKADTSLPAPVQAAQNVTERERAYAAQALEDDASKLEVMRAGDGRNAALNSIAYGQGTMAGAGWIDPSVVRRRLFDAATVNGHVAKHGERQIWATIESGLEAGMMKPRQPLDANVPLIDMSEMIENGIAKFKTRQASKGTTFRAVSSKRTVTILQGSAIQARAIHWLWPGYLPLGKLTLLAGEGGTGKSTIAFNFAATITKGAAWPDGSRCPVRGNVLIWSSEDDAADTIKPRMMAAGADDQRYGVITGTTDENGYRGSFDAARDMASLRVGIEQIGGASLLIIDPIVSVVAGDMHKANDVRRNLQPIADLAAECGFAVLGITHYAKDTKGKNPAERIIGSQAFAAFARMCWGVVQNPETGERVFTRVKTNISSSNGGFYYSLDEVWPAPGIQASRVVWGASVAGSARTIMACVEGLSDGEDRGKVSRVKQYLTQALAYGPAPAKGIIDSAIEQLSVSKNTVTTAKRELNIESRKNGMGGWNWVLPLYEQINTARTV